jgi:lipopolysaccharide biosynthesis glycosyltransferase
MSRTPQPGPPAAASTPSTGTGPEPVAVVCAVDRVYAMGSAVMLQSALEHFRDDRQLWVFVLDGGVTPGQRARIEKILARFGARHTWIVQDTAELEGLSTVDYISASTFLRLLIPSLLPAEVRKAVYLDSDLLVEADLAELWSTDVSDVYLAAAPDPGVSLVSAEEGLLNWRELGFAEGDRYFNAGVLVMNLERWRAEGFGARVLEYVRGNPRYIRWGDQDGLNAVVARHWRELPERWNRLPRDDAAPAPQIVHFLTGRKPWRAFRLGDAGSRWHQTLRRSGYLPPAEWASYRLKSGLLYLSRWARRKAER